MLLNFSFNRFCKAISLASVIVIGTFFNFPAQKASAQIPNSGLKFLTDLVTQFASLGINCSSNLVEAQSKSIADFNNGITDCAVTVLTLPNVSGQIVVNPVNVPIDFAYNVPGVNLQLNKQQVCGIISGTITQWSQVGGPNLPITFIYRSDSSSTTVILNNFTQNSCGFSLPPFPVGTGVVGGSGVINKIKSTTGAIGYIDRPTALEASLPVAMLVDTSISGPIYVVFRNSYNDFMKTLALKSLCLEITSSKARNLAVSLGYDAPPQNPSACNGI